MADKQNDESDSLARSSLIEAAAIITLIGPTWRIFKRGRKFDDYLRHRGAAIHYIFVSSVVAATGLKFGKAFETDVDKGLGNHGMAESESAMLDPDHWLAPINALIQKASPSGIDVKLDLSDLLPFFYLIFAVVAAMLTHVTFLLGRRTISPRLKVWLRPSGISPQPNSYATTTAAICFGLGFFLLLSSGQAVVLFAENRLQAAHFFASQTLVWVWMLVAVRAFWVTFVALPLWLRKIYAVRLWAIYLSGWVISSVLYGIGWLISRAF